MKNIYYKLMTSYNHCSIYTMYKMYINVDNKIVWQSSKLDFRIYWPENFKIIIFI
jgi:hypothetical protein